MGISVPYESLMLTRILTHDELNDTTYIPQTGDGQMAKCTAEISDAVGAVFSGGQPPHIVASRHTIASVQTIPATEAGAQQLKQPIERQNP